MKKIIFIVLVFLVTFLIYSLNVTDKIYYVSLGDFLAYGINNRNIVDNNFSDNIKNQYKGNLKNYVNYSNINDYRVMDLINDINYNKTIIYRDKEYKLQNLLVKANLITLSIGMNDLIYRNILDYDYIDNLLSDMDNLFEIIRKYNKDKIYYLGFYNVIDDKDMIEYINLKLKSYCKKHGIQYVDISKLDKYIIKGIYPTNDGYTYITEKINFEKK